MTQIDRRYSVAEGTAIKAPCRVATTANITLGGLQVVDGVTVVEHDRVLVWKQTDQTLNGIYEASTGNWRRTKDFDGAYDIVAGTKVDTVSGNTYLGATFRVITPDPIVIGTTEIEFRPSSNAVISSDGEILVTDPAFGATGNGVTNDYASLVLARAAAVAGGYRLVFPAGTYNLGANQLEIAFNNLKIQARGPVTIKGTHPNAVILHTGTLPLKYGVEFGWGGDPITVEGTGLHGIELIAPDHSKFRARCTGATSKAFRIRSGVASEFEFTCSSNEPGGLVTVPVNGISIEDYGSGYGLVTDCIFHKPIIEGVSGDGILNEGGGENNTILGGTGEANGGSGYAESYPARNNTIIGLDCEANTVGDFYLAGINTQLINCRGLSSGSAQSLILDNAANIANGGSFVSIAVAASHKKNILFNAAYGTFTDAGTDTIHFGMRDESVIPAVYLPSQFGVIQTARYTVANLPASAAAGQVAYATNGRAFNGAGTLEGAGLGTGVPVTYSDSGNWKITGTNVTVSA